MEPMFTKDMTHSGMGKMKTQSLFIETARPGDDPFLSLRPQKDNGMVSLRDLFIQYTTDDPSEVTFSEVVFGDYEFWLNLLKCKWMQPYAKQWRTIADARRKAKAFRSMIEEVENKGKSAFSAAKYLIDEPWKDKRSPKTKEDSKESTNRAFSEVNEDFERLKQSGLIQ